MVSSSVKDAVTRGVTVVEAETDTVSDFETEGDSDVVHDSDAVPVSSAVLVTGAEVDTEYVVLDDCDSVEDSDTDSAPVRVPESVPPDMVALAEAVGSSEKLTVVVGPVPVCDADWVADMVVSSVLDTVNVCDPHVWVWRDRVSVRERVGDGVSERVGVRE